MGTISLEHASALSSYPFMNPSFFNFHCWNQNGVGPVVTFQDMVMQGSNGALPHGGVNSSEIGNKANVCGNDNSLDASSDQATPILNLESPSSSNMNESQLVPSCGKYWNLRVTLGLGHPLVVMLALNQLQLVEKLAFQTMKA